MPKTQHGTCAVSPRTGYSKGGGINLGLEVNLGFHFIRRRMRIRAKALLYLLSVRLTTNEKK